MTLLLLLPPARPAAPVVEVVSPELDDHVFIAWNNLIDTSILSGGAWLEELPLANLKNRVLARVARSVDAQPASTWFDIDTGPDRIWRILALQDHNASVSARYRVRAGEDPTFATVGHDSGWLDIWPGIYSSEELDWDQTNWWEGTYSKDERSGYIWTLFHKLSEAVNFRYVRVEIDDVVNEASAFQIGRPFIGNGYSPSLNMIVGASLGWEDPSEVVTGYGGAEYFNELPRYRVARFTMANLGVNEMYSQAFEIIRQAGVTKEIVLQWNPADDRNAIRQSFVGRLRQLSPIEHPYPHLTSVAFEAKETTR